MAGIDQAESNRLVDAWMGTASYPAPTTPLKAYLCSNTGTNTSAGTEITGGSYVKQTAAFSAASAGATSNTGLISYGNMPAVTVNSIEIKDTAGSPVRKAFAALTTPKTTQAGDTLSFAIGAIQPSLV